MELNEIQLGAELIVRGHVTTILGREGAPRESQAVILRLLDGQALNTNVGNLECGAVTAEPTPAADAVASVQAEFEQRIAQLEADVHDAQAATKQAETECADWKGKAQQAERAASELATQLEAAKAAKPATKK